MIVDVRKAVKGRQDLGEGVIRINQPYNNATGEETTKDANAIFEVLRSTLPSVTYNKIQDLFEQFDGAIHLMDEDSVLKYIIIVGNVVDGLRFYGPYDSADEANEVADNTFRNEDWVVTNITL